MIQCWNIGKVGARKIYGLWVPIWSGRIFELRPRKGKKGNAWRLASTFGDTLARKGEPPKEFFQSIWDDSPLDVPYRPDVRPNMTEACSYKAELMVRGQWIPSNLRFEDREAAVKYAKDITRRWKKLEKWRVLQA